MKAHCRRLSQEAGCRQHIYTDDNGSSFFFVSQKLDCLRLSELPEDVLEHIRGFLCLQNTHEKPCTLPYLAARYRKAHGTRLLKAMWGTVTVRSWAWVIKGKMACCDLFVNRSDSVDLFVFGDQPEDLDRGDAIYECFHARGINGSEATAPHILTPEVQIGDCVDVLCKVTRSHMALFYGERVADVVRADAKMQKVVMCSGAVLTIDDSFSDFKQFTHAICGDSADVFLEDHNPFPVMRFAPSFNQVRDGGVVTAVMGGSKLSVCFLYLRRRATKKRSVITTKECVAPLLQSSAS